jgi:hypothetical protein
MTDIAPPAPLEGSNGKPIWEAATDGVDRLPVPGGWIYRTALGHRRSWIARLCVFTHPRGARLA